MDYVMRISRGALSGFEIVLLLFIYLLLFEVLFRQCQEVDLVCNSTLSLASIHSLLLVSMAELGSKVLEI